MNLPVAFFLSIVFLAGCSFADEQTNRTEEKTIEGEETVLGTDGELSKYHYLVKEPHSVGLQHRGFIVAIEKSLRLNIKAPPKPNFDTKRFRQWESGGKLTSEQSIEARQAHFLNILEDPKLHYVSHVLEYHPDPKGQQRFSASLSYSAYRNTGYINTENGGDTAPVPVLGLEKDESPYQAGYEAMDRLESRLLTVLENASGRNEQFTHLVIASMGWNNDQVESIRRYNALLGNTIAASRDPDSNWNGKFNPLFIGLTWPSVWGGDSFFNSLNLFNHLISYPNKANDADEVGYTIANYLVNRIGKRLKAKYPTLKVVLIGHSMGARILSRAMFSGPLLRDWDEREPSPVDVMIGLQSAFSVRRFKPNNSLIFPFSLFHKGEGSPYVDFRDEPGQIVLTWSDNDSANPLAQFLTGAAHAGGSAGYEESLNIEGVFRQLEWKKEDTSLRTTADKSSEGCPRHQNGKQVLMIQADEIVKDHNDILGTGMGHLIWSSIRCYAMPNG